MTSPTALLREGRCFTPSRPAMAKPSGSRSKSFARQLASSDLLAANPSSYQVETQPPTETKRGSFPGARNLGERCGPEPSLSKWWQQRPSNSRPASISFGARRWLLPTPRCYGAPIAALMPPRGPGAQNHSCSQRVAPENQLPRACEASCVSFSKGFSRQPRTKPRGAEEPRRVLRLQPPRRCRPRGKELQQKPPQIEPRKHSGPRSAAA